MRSNRSNNRNQDTRNNGKSSSKRSNSSASSRGRNNSGSSKSTNGKGKAGADKFNMLTVGTAYGKWVETRNGSEAFKVAIVLKKDEDGESACVDEQENEYTHEEAVKLLAEALLSGKRLNLYMFESQYESDYDDTHQGNARIDIKGISLDDIEADEETEEEEPAPKKQQTKSKNSNANPSSRSTTAKKRKYEEEIQEQDDETEENIEEVDEEETNDIPF